jgi:nucleoside-diphosphate-sugar epimerase
VKTLITGVSGFIGQNLLKQNLAGEIHVITRKNVNSLNPKIIQHHGDLRDLSKLKELASLNFDRLIHLAWSGLPSLTQEHNESNLQISKNLIEILSDSGVKEFNMIGSCLEYGKLDTLASEEDVGTDICNFGETKLQLLDYLKSKTPNYRWMRVFYAFGPHQHSNSLLRQGYLYAKSGGTLPLANPKVSRDFVYVDDVTRGIVLLVDKENEFGVYNIGSGISTSTSEMIKLVNEEMGLPSNVSEAGSITLRADTRKIQKACGWTPAFDISSGVRMSVQWMIKNNV